MTDTPMAEAPDTSPASTIDQKFAATAGSADHTQQRRDRQHAAAEQAPPMTEFPPASTFPREHPPREPTSRQSTSRLYDNSPPDRKPSHFSTYPTASDPRPQTPYSGMSAPSIPRAHTRTSAERIPHLASYPTAPGSAPQTPQLGSSQQGGSAAGWLVPPPANPTSKITFEGTFDCSSPTVLVSCSFMLPLKEILPFRLSEKKRNREHTKREGPSYLTTAQHRLPLPLRNHLRMERQL